jgi:uncharacterized protein (TIGR02118 family)
MLKLIALYKHPPDPEGFDRHFREVHLPLLRQFPGLIRLEVSRITGAPIGESRYHAIAEAYFRDQDALDAAFASKEGKAVIRDIMSFAADVITVFYGETEETA